MMFDSHAHLSDGDFDKDRSEVIKRARQAGVEEILCVHCASPDLKDLDRFAGILKDNDFICGAAGIHPHDARNVDKLWKGLEAEIARVRTTRPG